MVFNKFSNVKATKSSSISMDDLVSAVRAPKLACQQALLAGKGSEEYDRIKTSELETFYPNAFLPSLTRKGEGSSTGVIYLDFDNFSSEQEAIEFKASIVREFPFVAAAWLSLSRVGVAVLFRVRSSNSTNHFQYWSFIDNLVGRTLNRRADHHAHNFTRLCAIPFDNEVYYNETCLSLEDIYEEILMLESTIEGGCSASSKNKRDNKNWCSPLTTSPIGDYRYKTYLSDEHFADVNTPIYAPSKILHINLKKLAIRRIKTSNRTHTLGAMSIQLMGIYPHCSENEILNTVLGWNRRFCIEELPYQEVLNLVTANFKKFQAGKIDLSKYMEIKHVHYHRACTLSAREKQSASTKLILQHNKKGKEYSQQRINDAIIELQDGINEINKRAIQKHTGLSEYAVKRYWKPFKDIIEKYNKNLLPATNQLNLLNDEKSTSISLTEKCDSTLVNDDVFTINDDSDLDYLTYLQTTGYRQTLQHTFQGFKQTSQTFRACA